MTDGCGVEDTLEVSGSIWVSETCSAAAKNAGASALLESNANTSIDNSRNRRLVSAVSSFLDVIQEPVYAPLDAFRSHGGNTSVEAPSCPYTWERVTKSLSGAPDLGCIAARTPMIPFSGETDLLKSDGIAGPVASTGTRD